MHIADFQALLTPAGQAVLAAAAEQDLAEPKLVAALSRLRLRYPADLVATAVTQLRLRARAVAKFGPDAARMYFTPAGLEQSTRASVAAHRAARLGGLDGPVLELCTGIGADLLARTRLGGAGGVGIELDPLTAAVAGANLAAFGVAELAEVRVGDAAAADPRGFAAVFADPGRRSGRGRIFDPKAYQPPLDVLLEIAGRAPAGCLKVAPGIPHEAIPAGAEAEWVSDGGEVKEAALWLGALAGTARRRATLLPSGATLTGTGAAAAVGDWGRYLYEPDGAVVRAHLVAEAAERVDAVLVDPHIAYLTGDTLVPTPYAKAYEIVDVLPFSLKRLRAELRRRDVGTVTIKKRGSAVDVERLRHDLRTTGTQPMTVALTRVGTAPQAVLCRPVGR